MPGLMAAQPLVLPPRPTDQIFVAWSQGEPQHGRVVAPVIVDPPLHDWIEHPRQVPYGLVATQLQPLVPDLPPDLLAGLVAQRRAEVDEVPVVLLASAEARAKRVPEEIESFVLVGPSPTPILAVDNARFGRTDLQLALR